MALVEMLRWLILKMVELEMSARRPITDVSLHQLRKKIRRAYVQAKELQDKHNKLLKAGEAAFVWGVGERDVPPFILDRLIQVPARHPSFIQILPSGRGPHPSKRTHSDVRRLEQFADCAQKLVGDLECANSRKNSTLWHLFEGRFHNSMATFVKYCIPTEEGVEEQQKRCSKYSRAAIGFAISTLSGCMVSESFSTVDTAVKLAVAASSSVAVTAGLVSWRMKSVWGRFFLVYITSFHLLTMTFFVFISFDKAYGYYAALLVPLIIGAVFLLRKLWAGPGDDARRQSTAGDDRLDFMFNLSDLILSLDSFTSIAGLFPSGPNKYYYIGGAGAAGFLFFSTILLSLYLMMVSTVRTAALTLHAKHLDVLLIVLLVSTLTSTAVAFLYFPDQATEWEVPT